MYPGGMSAAERSRLEAEILRNVRRRTSPAPNAAGAKLRTCRTCGDPFWDWSKESYRPCPDCSAARLVAVNVARATKTGPLYEQAVRRQLAYWLSEAERLGLTPDAK